MIIFIPTIIIIFCFLNYTNFIFRYNFQYYKKKYFLSLVFDLNGKVKYQLTRRISKKIQST